MKCFVCGESIIDDSSAILLTTDGDFACGTECKEKYERDKAHFFNHVITSEKNFMEWWNND